MRKLILACGVGFDAYVAPEEIPTFGISAVLPMDVEQARAKGRVLRLCAFARRAEDGALSAYVEPTLVCASAPEAAILKNVNYAWYQGESYGLMSYTGQGAGKLPTAANVLRDVQSVSAGARYMTSEACRAVQPDNSAARHPYYIRIADAGAIPAEWIARSEAIDGESCIETVPVSVQEMHNLMANHRDAFFAGLQRG